ncbi:hypothetical protein PGT21_024504 [Puccinia graminis f. sp. tritici]|uniref:Uncharacterized protein n=1 Tax=Puccinia graminis f. sp. tritici TaxID=56615 RepID=A0A5B0MFJ7_PUCGR|nr:hypothetical protein PGT21_024504 [Puccinia graminis f. sp. tritici]
MGAMNAFRMLVANGMPPRPQIGTRPVSAEHIPAGPRPALGAIHPPSSASPLTSGALFERRLFSRAKITDHHSAKVTSRASAASNPVSEGVSLSDSV